MWPKRILERHRFKLFGEITCHLCLVGCRMPLIKGKSPFIMLLLHQLLILTSSIYFIKMMISLEFVSLLDPCTFHLLVPLILVVVFLKHSFWFIQFIGFCTFNF